MNPRSRYWIDAARTAAGLVMFCCAGTAHGLAQEPLSPETRRVLRQMDSSAKTLRTLSADMKETKVTVIVDDVSEKSGKLFFRKARRRIKMVYENPHPRTLLLESGKIRILQPRIKRYSEIENDFVLGPSSGSIQKDYDVEMVRHDPVEGQQTSLLELKPRSSKLKAQFPKIELWVDHRYWIPIKIRITESSDDLFTILLSNIKINPRLPPGTFRMQVPSGYKRFLQTLTR